MSKELARFKYNKDIIKCIEESWDYYGEEDEQRKVIKELKNVYKIASSAKNAPKPEYEAKAKAWDAMKKDFEDIADTPMGQQILLNMSIIKERVESGESE